LIYRNPTQQTMEAGARDPKLRIGSVGWPLKVGAGLRAATKTMAMAMAKAAMAQIQRANDNDRMKQWLMRVR
jgi:hypothetical protein